MSWSDWEFVWRRQKPPIGANADLAFLIQTYESKRRKMANALIARDLMEAAAGVFVTIVFSRAAWRLQEAAWMMWISVALVLGVTAFFLWERIRVRRHRLGPDASMLQKLEAELAEIRHQRRLLSNVGNWYLLPLGLAVILGFTALSINAPPHSFRRDPYFVGGYALFCVALGQVARWMNRRVVRKQLDPRIEEMEKLHQHLISGEGTP